MRKELKQMTGVRATFSATFKRFGWKRDYGRDKKTLLLVDIADENGQRLTDHVWFSLTKGFEAFDLKPGDRLRFDARVKPYEAGYRGQWWEQALENPPRIDYKLSHPTRITSLPSE